MVSVSDFRALLNEGNWRWNGEVVIGTPTVVAFSFAQSLGAYQTVVDRPGFTPMTELQKHYVRLAVQALDRVSGLDFTEVPDSDQAQIRIGMHDFSGTSTSGFSGYGYYPGTLPRSVAGDVWFNTSVNIDFTPGTRGFELILHELGHAVGMKHPHEGDVTLAPAFDTNLYTVMSYNKVSPRPQVPMQFDVEALSWAYGDGVLAENAVQATYIAASNRIKIDTQLIGDQGPTVSGTHLSDLIIGTIGNDTLAGSAGNDVLNGGAGIDRAIYLGYGTDYTVTVDHGLYTVRPKSSGWAADANGTDFLVNVETISFLGYDTSITNSQTAVVQQLASIALDQSASDKIYRFFNTASGTHFFTGSIEERNHVIGNDALLSYEGPAFGGSRQSTGTVSELAVFRFFNSQTGTHFYTASTGERDSIINTLPQFTFEGISYYGFGDGQNGSHIALYRFHNTSNGSHFYTASTGERDQIIETLGHYRYEGIAYYVDV